MVLDRKSPAAKGCDVHRLRKDASVNRFCRVEMCKALRLAALHPPKVMGFQWLRDETDPACCPAISSGTGLRSGKGPSNRSFARKPDPD